MDTTIALCARAQAAATAMERLMRALIIAEKGAVDSTTEAYIQRALGAAAEVADDPLVGQIQPNSNYLGRLTHVMQTTAARNP